jgi:thioredoxin-dependent peroxiredoxin
MIEAQVMVEIGELAPQFCLPGDSEQDVCLKDYLGKWLVLYFYPKDNTSGCTREAVDFTAALPVLQDLGAVVLGVSRDSPASHRKFAEKHGLKVMLASDQDHRVTEAYGAWALKKMYGKESYSAVRSTFLIDPQGKIAHVWKKVSVKGHADAVAKKLRELVQK